MRTTTALLLAALAAVAATPAAAGVYFAAVTTANGGETSTVRVWVEGDKARVEFASSRSPLLKPGRYLLTLDGGRSVYLVDPAERTFSQWSGDAAIWAAGSPAAPPAAGWEQVGDDEGGVLAGVATRHLRYRAVAGPAAAGKAPAGGAPIEEDLWVAPELAGAALGAWMRPASGDAGGEAPDAAAAVESARYGMFPLKRISVAPAPGRGGARTVVRTSTTVTELSVEDVSPSTFTMGSGFREKPLGPGAADAEPPAADSSAEAPQEDQQYPFEEMLQPDGQPAPGQPAQPGAAPGQPQPVTQPAVAPSPPPYVPEEPQPPQEDPEYPFERMLDTPN